MERSLAKTDNLSLAHLDRAALEQAFEERNIFLMRCPVAGTYFHNGRLSFDSDTRVPFKVIVQREPQNTHDKLAIAVLTEDGERIGYIPRDKNEVVARLLDAGMIIEARATSIELLENEADISIELTLKEV